MSFYTTKHLVDYLADNTKGTNLRVLMQYFESFAEDIHSVLEDLREELSVSTATEQNLDNVGYGILSQLRVTGQADGDYRNDIEFQIKKIHATCEVDTVSEATQILTEGDHVRLFEHSVANIIVYANGTGYPGISRDLHKVVAAGVGLGVVVSNGEPLAFLKDDGTPPSWGLPWSENGDATPDGGVISEQYTN